MRVMGVRHKTEEEINAQALHILSMLEACPTHFVGCGGRLDRQAIWQMARREKTRRGIPLFRR